jgi:hypothetical protein
MCTSSAKTMLVAKGIPVVNITFTIDEQVAQSASEAAQKMGKKALTRQCWTT